MATTDNADAIRNARSSIKKLFTRLDIKRVVCVDDQYDQQPSLSKFLDFYKFASEDFRSEDFSAFPGLQAIVLADPDLIRDRDLEKLWDGLTPKDQKRLFILIRTKVNSKNDTDYAQTLKKVFQPQVVELKELSLAQWRREKPQFLSEAKEVKTLFLFDRDFRSEGGAENEGETLIEDILVSGEEDTIMCGLLSHTFGIEEEHSRLEEYGKENKTNKDSFIFISKKQLRDNPLEFARRIKLTALSPKFKKLKEISSNIIEAAHSKAFKEVDKIDIYDFEHIIFQSSALEGIWEPDTLFRLFGIHHRSSAREMARSDDQLYELATNIRPISTVSIDSIDAPEHLSWQIRKLELYENSDYINNLRMPIELGDIFDVKLQNNLKRFILIAQPCDLMVRTSGKRKQTMTEVTFAEIIGLEDIQRKDEKGDPLDQDAFFELPYFAEDRTKRFVSFQKKYSIKLSIIDLCVYQGNGFAFLDINDPCPKRLIPTWESHYKDSIAKMKELIDQYEQINKACSKLLQEEAKQILDLTRARILALPEVFLLDRNEKTSLFTGDIDLVRKIVSYNLKRSGRLCQEYSTALLAKFAAFLARDAFEHDFGRDKEQ